MTKEFKTTCTWEKMDEPEFPCLFVPIKMSGKSDWVYDWNESFITECKIRGAGHYFYLINSELQEK